jgi:glutathione synthase/RimK-type ligase-like ATP-grasp enzyme
MARSWSLAAGTKRGRSARNSGATRAGARRRRALSRLSTEVERLARRCGEAFGLRLYGLDLAEDDSGLYVVDVNYFPGYRGVPDAAARLARYIVSLARQ